MCIRDRYSFDIQPEAIERTQTRLDAAKITNVTLLQQSHENLTQHLDQADVSKVSAVMFNLGYLPGGSKAITTTPESTRNAIVNAAKLIQPGGVISILVYVGHDGGREEAEVVVSVLNELAEGPFEVSKHKAPVDRPVAPILYLLRK